MHKQRFFWLIPLIAATLVPTALAGASALPRNGEIAFTVQFDTAQLFSVRPNVSKAQRLTTDLAENYQPVASPEPSWSPDGSQILFASWRTGMGVRSG